MKPEMGPPDTKLYEFAGPDESWQKEMTEFEEDIRCQRTPSAGLAEARVALQMVEQIYLKSGFDFDSAMPKP
jgi:hypothetical protein